MGIKKDLFTKVQAVLSASRTFFEELSLVQSAKSLPSLPDAERAMLLQNVLVNLGICHEITYRLNAERLGIPLKGVFVRFVEESATTILHQAELGGDQALQVEVVLETSASQGELESLKDIVDRRCPGLHALRSFAPVQSSVRSSSWSVAAE